MESILTSIKKLLGITEDYDHFDADIIMHINSVFMVLNQLGVGPSEGFAIDDKNSKWSDFLPEASSLKLKAVQSYMYLRVRILFDPPTGTVLESMNDQIKELEWRLNVAAESTYSGGTTGGSGIDYEKLENLPSINGEKLVGNYDEKDPTVKSIPSSDVDDIWNELFEE